MANDKLFHRRKERAAKDMARGQAALSPYDKILIVCEGAKTEKYYFEELAKYYNINSHNIKIAGGDGNPMSIIARAKTEYRKSVIRFDKVYCVFDKNSHADYDQARAQLEHRRNFEAVFSVPCFEYWLLLHYCYTTKPFAKKGNKSACDQVISELKKHIPRYNKGDRNTFDIVRGNLPAAQANAKKSLKAAKGAGTDNPSTNVHLLVEHLKSLPKN